MKKLFIFLSIITELTCFSQDNILVNDAKAEKRILNASFNAITVSDGIEQLLTQGNTEAIAVSASSQEYIGRLKTVVENAVLKIYYDDKSVFGNSDSKRKLKAYLSFKSLEKIKASSGANVIVMSELNLDKLTVSFSSGSLFSAKLNVKNFEVDQNSGAEIVVTGAAANLKIGLSSGAIF